MSPAIKRYIYFHNKRHPKDMGRKEIEAFLTDLAVKGNLSASTQNQALDHADLAPVQGDEQRNRLTCIWQFYI